MIVNCDKCGQEYDVDELRLPPQGARIRCPNCRNLFLVRPNRSPLSTVMPIVDETDLGGDLISANEPAVGDEWRVRQSGLTYTFPKLDALRNWLSARPSLDDVKVAKNEDDWKELGDYPEILTTEMIMKFFPLGDVPSSTSSSTSRSLSGSFSNSGLSSALSNTLTSNTLTGIKTNVNQTSSDLSQSVKSKSKRQIKLEQEKAQKAKQESSKRIAICLLGGVFLLGAVLVSIYAVEENSGIIQDDFTGEVVLPEPYTFASTSYSIKKDQNSKSTNTNRKPNVARQKQDNGGTPLSDEEIAIRREQERAELLREEDENRNKRLAEARTLVDEKKWPEARATLESLNEERPEHLETLQLLAKTYRGLGLNDKANETEANVKRVIAEEKRQEDAAQEMVFGDE